MTTAGRARAFARTSLAVLALACVAGRVVSVDALESLTSRAAALASQAPDHPLVERAVDALVRLERAVDGTFKRLWTTVLARFHPFVIAGPLTFAYHEAVYFGAWLPWLAMDQFDYFKRWKIQPDKTPSREMVTKCLIKLLKSHVFIQLPMQMMFYFVAPYFGFSLALEALPKSRDFLWQIPVFFVIEDFYFYWIHRFLHHKRVYKYVHKIHHEHKYPFGIAAEYAHPVETFFLGIGTLLGPLFFAKHMVTLWVWLFFRLVETVEDHSGYDVPWNPTNLIPFWGGAVHHDFHHKTFEGPYSSVFTWCDWMFGTDKEFRAHQKKLRSGKESWAYPAVFRGAPNEKSLDETKAAKKLN
jgi:methylsterol monooxygenase